MAFLGSYFVAPGNTPCHFVPWAADRTQSGLEPWVCDCWFCGRERIRRSRTSGYADMIYNRVERARRQGDHH